MGDRERAVPLAPGTACAPTGLPLRRAALWRTARFFYGCVALGSLQGNVVLCDGKYEVLSLLRSHR